MTARRALLTLAFAFSACVQLSYSVRTEDSPVSPDTLATLQVGTDDLASCLGKLGAPHHVFEYQYDGMALLWHHVDTSGWGANFSMNFARNAPGARFSMDSDSADMPGAMLWFDRDYRLLRWRSGLMRDLTAQFRRRPADLDQQDRRGN